MKILVALSFLTLLGIYAAKAEMRWTPQGGTENDILPTYLKEEAVRIFNEGDRIKGEAERLRSESARLNSEGQRLRTNAALLDALWLDEDHLWHLGRYSGYNRSQVRMRSDAVKLDYDANVLSRRSTIA